MENTLLEELIKKLHVQQSEVIRDAKEAKVARDKSLVVIRESEEKMILIRNTLSVIDKGMRPNTGKVKEGNDPVEAMDPVNSIVVEECDCCKITKEVFKVLVLKESEERDHRCFLFVCPACLIKVWDLYGDLSNVQWKAHVPLSSTEKDFNTFVQWARAISSHGAFKKQETQNETRTELEEEEFGVIKSKMYRGRGCTCCKKKMDTYLIQVPKPDCPASKEDYEAGWKDEMYICPKCIGKLMQLMLEQRHLHDSSLCGNWCEEAAKLIKKTKEIIT